MPVRAAAGGIRVSVVIRKGVVALIAVLLLAGCSGRAGIYHRVEKGQTIYRIARAYGIDIRELMEVNDIEDPRVLRTGQPLWIPGAAHPIRVPPYAGGKTGSSRLVGRHWVRPVRGTISSGFGGRSGRMHEGVDILANRGTPVRAAAHGVVIYAGDRMRGYGNAVVLDHGDEITTLYGHLDTIRVQSGDAVGQGQRIGTVGSTGNATTTHLHFELRVGGDAIDPESILQGGRQGR
jgi:murein DD-endopeptidase MepM/ murein hydrolase activator NlpD